MNNAKIKYLRHAFFMLVVCLLVLVHEVVPSQAAVNGVFRQIENQQVLNLWGSNYEMGYAHGYLMADRIRDLIDHYLIGTVAGGSLSAYNDLLANDASQFQWQPQYQEEITGMADGMAASGKNLYVASLQRNIDARDIRALNLQEEYSFGCSSFGVWRNATASGETILGRNLDFYYDREGNNANYQMIIAYEPTAKTRFISFAWPGFVGVYSGMNEYGITVMANTGNIANPYGGPFHPVMEVYRTILETTTPESFLTQPLSVVTSVHENPSEIIQIGNPYQGGYYPVYYIEQSPDVDLIRSYADNGYDHIIASNHFLSVIPPPSSGESLYRYDTIRNGLIGLYETGDSKVDSTEAFEILGRVANIVAPTLTSIVIRPNRMEFDLSYAKMINGVFTAATDLQPQTYRWDSLFPDQSLVAVNDAYSTAAYTTLYETTPGVLGNDTGTGATLSAQLVSGPSHGALTLNTDGSFSYAPVASYVGSDNFTYLATDGVSTSNIATVTITVTSTAGVLFSDDFDRNSGVPDPLAPWTQVLGTWTVTSGVLQGTSAASTYASLYTGSLPLWTDYSVEGIVQLPVGAFGGGLGGRVNPATGARYGAWIYPSGSLGGSNVLKLVKFRDWSSWNFTPMKQVNLPTVGTGGHTLKLIFNSSQIQVYYDGTLMIDLTDNNFDSRPAYLSGGISADLWTYTSPYLMGVDNIVVRSLSSSNLSPVAVDDNYSTSVNTALNQTAPGVLSNDSDPEGAALTAQLVSAPSHGSLTFNSNGSFVYTPATNYVGSDSFTYWSYDGINYSNNAATITVLSAISLNSLTLSPTSVTGGTSAQGTVTLSAPAPSGGTLVSLSDNSYAASVPSSVTVASGSTNATFAINTTPVKRSRTVTISASYSGVTKTATLRVLR